MRRVLFHRPRTDRIAAEPVENLPFTNFMDHLWEVSSLSAMMVHVRDRPDRRSHG
jgi:hypothetical protein